MKNFLFSFLVLFAPIVITAQTITLPLANFEYTDSCHFTYGSVNMQLSQFYLSPPNFDTYDPYCDILPSDAFKVRDALITGSLILPGDTVVIADEDGWDCCVNVSLYSQNQLVDETLVYVDFGEGGTFQYINVDNALIVDSIVISDYEVGIFKGDLGAPAMHRDISIRLNRLPISHYYIPASGEITLLRKGLFDEKNQTPFKVCTDGSTSSRFVITKEDFNFNNFQWTLRIKEDPDGDEPSLYGHFQKDWINSTNEELVFEYTHPAYLSGDEQDTITIQFFDPVQQLVLGEHLLKLYRTPVLMVHGLWGSESSFYKMFSRLLNLEEYEDYQLLICDYENSNDEEFEVNQEIVKECISNDKGLLNQVLNKKIAVSKVDIIAHSMGGIVSRLYLQSAEFKNDINKLITIGTPHSGSQLANLILDPDFSYASSRFCNFIRFLLRLGRCDEGAVDNLRIDSDAITNLNLANQPPVAKHAITSIIEYESIPYQLRLILEDEFMLNAILFAALFGGELNDALVTESSQGGGLPINAISPFQEVFHTNTLEDNDVFSTIKNLLEVSPNDGAFTTEPFKEMAQSYNPTSFSDQELDIMPLNIIEPANSSQFLAGDELTVTVSAPSDVSKTVVYFRNDSGGFPEAKEIDSNEGSVTFNISKTPLGERRIGVSGYGSNGLIAMSYIDVFVDIDELPEKLHIMPTFAKVEVDDTITFSVLGSFDGLITELNDLPGLTYSFSHNILNHVGENVIEAKEIGTTEMVVNFRGVESKPIEIEVIEADTTTSIEPNPHFLLEKGKITLNVFPNPAERVMEVQASSLESRELTLEVRDVLGRVLISKKISSSNGEFQKLLDVSTLSKGVYLLSLSNERTGTTAKFIKA